MIPNLEIGTIALIPIIVALIEAFKAAGLPSKYAPWANAVATAIGYAIIVLLQQYPTYEPATVVVLTMMMIFLSAGGFYEVVSRTIAMVKKD